MTQFKHLAERFGKSEAGSPEERRSAKRLLRWVLTVAGNMDMDASLLDELMTASNQRANSGCDRCECGCKYWENDTCIDCGTQHRPRHVSVEETG